LNAVQVLCEAVKARGELPISEALIVKSVREAIGLAISAQHNDVLHMAVYHLVKAVMADSRNSDGLLLKEVLFGGPEGGIARTHPIWSCPIMCYY